MVHFVGAGCGAPDLITLRGRRLLEEADVIVYAGSLVNPALLGFAKKDCRIYNSAQMTLEEVIALGPTLIKPNELEFSKMLGRPPGACTGRFESRSTA